MRGARNSLAVPLLFAGVLFASAPFVYGAVDRLETEPLAAPAPVTKTLTVPLLTQSTATGSIGHVRIVNHAMTAGTASIRSRDNDTDAGFTHAPDFEPEVSENRVRYHIDLCVGAGLLEKKRENQQAHDAYMETHLARSPLD